MIGRQEEKNAPGEPGAFTPTKFKSSKNRFGRTLFEVHSANRQSTSSPTGGSCSSSCSSASNQVELESSSFTFEFSTENRSK